MKTADIGSWQTFANVAKGLVMWSTQSLSLRFCLNGCAMTRKLKMNGGNNCTGNYSVKHPIHSPQSPLSFHLFLSISVPCSLWRQQGDGPLESSLGWELNDLVIWPDMQTLGWKGHSEYESVVQDWNFPTKFTNTQQQPQLSFNKTGKGGVKTKVFTMVTYSTG